MAEGIRYTRGARRRDGWPRSRTRRTSPRSVEAPQSRASRVASRTPREPRARCGRRVRPPGRGTPFDSATKARALTLSAWLCVLSLQSAKPFIACGRIDTIAMRARIPVVEIMTTTPITIPAEATAVEAAKIMRVRDIVGIVTENDILRIWPQLIAVTREYARAGFESQFAQGIEGHCEACGVYSTSLMWDRNLLVCSECRGG